MPFAGRRPFEADKPGTADWALGWLESCRPLRLSPTASMKRDKARVSWPTGRKLEQARRGRPASSRSVRTSGSQC